MTGCRHPYQVTIGGIWIFEFAVYDPEIWIAGILLWFPLRVWIRAAEGFVFAVELRRRRGSQRTNFIFGQFSQNYNCVFYKSEGVAAIFKLCCLAGCLVCGGNGVPWRIRLIFYQEGKFRLKASTSINHKNVSQFNHFQSKSYLHTNVH